MKGVLILSHGKMAEGMIDSLSLFYGDNIKQLDYITLEKDDNPNLLGKRIKEKVNELDSGSGVYVFADLYGGTPCNQAILQLTDNVELITGLNFPMVLELLATREFVEPSIDNLITVGKDGIRNIRDELAALNTDDEDE